MVDKEIKTLYYDLSSHQRDEYNRLWDDYSNAQMMVGKYVEDNKETYRRNNIKTIYSQADDGKYY